jgi:hypothetical protein
VSVTQLPKPTIKTGRSATAVRGWMRGRWALAFSHPDDFASYGFEADRWLFEVHQELSSCDVAAIGLAESDMEHSWIHEVGGCFADLAIAPEGTEERRFVAIVDPDLRIRHMMTYASSTSLPSPIDLAHLAVSLRNAHQRSRRTAHRVHLVLATIGAFIVGARVLPALFRGRTA